MRYFHDVVVGFDPHQPVDLRQTASDGGDGIAQFHVLRMLLQAVGQGLLALQASMGIESMETATCARAARSLRRSYVLKFATWPEATT